MEGTETNRSTPCLKRPLHRSQHVPLTMEVKLTEAVIFSLLTLQVFSAGKYIFYFFKSSNFWGFKYPTSNMSDLLFKML